MTPETLEQQRRDLGLSRQDVADALGVSYNCVRLWEQGHRIPTAEHRLALASFFDQAGLKNE